MKIFESPGILAPTIVVLARDTEDARGRAIKHAICWYWETRFKDALSISRPRALTEHEDARLQNFVACILLDLDHHGDMQPCESGAIMFDTDEW